MPLNIQNSRLEIKYSTITGATPSIAPSQDHTDGTWTPDDIYVGEFYLNAIDDQLWIRTLNGIIPIMSGTGSTASPIWTFVNKTGDTMTGDLILPGLSFSTATGSTIIAGTFGSSASVYYGDGSHLTGITSNWNGGTVSGTSSFTGVLNLSTAQVTLNEITTSGLDINGNLNVNGNIQSTGGIFQGDGSGLYNIPGIDSVPVHHYNAIVDLYTDLTGSGLTPSTIVNLNYNLGIADGSDYDMEYDLYFWVTDVNVVDFANGWRKHYVPKYSAPYWNPYNTYSIGDKVRYSNFIFQNINGNVGSVDVNTYFLDPTEWTMLPTDSNYEWRTFGISYDLLTGEITKQWDENGNEVFCYQTTLLSQTSPQNTSDISDWNLPDDVTNNKTKGTWGNVYSSGGGVAAVRGNIVNSLIHTNRTTQIYNNIVGIGSIKNNIATSYIINNKAQGIYSNTTTQLMFNDVSLEINNNSIDSAIAYNHNIKINGNTGTGNISSNRGGYISNNTNFNSISGNFCQGQINGNDMGGNNIVGNITGGQISGNTITSGDIDTNKVTLDIDNNTIPITYNTALQITDNTGGGSINENVVNGVIASNNVSGGIAFNRVSMGINDNVNNIIYYNDVKSIMFNNMSGYSITNNSGACEIKNNTCGGNIDKNHVLYQIYNNSNAGIIQNNMALEISNNI